MPGPSGPSPPGVGPTPRDEVCRRGKARLYRYHSRRTHPMPVLFVPNLGIGRPFLFDLLPGSSLVEHLTAAGLDVYLLDWGVFGPEDDGLGLERCVRRTLPSMWRAMLDTSGVSRGAALGYCMGAALVTAFAASEPEVELAALVDLAGPIDFSRAGLLRRWLDRRHVDCDRLVEVLGGIPPELVLVGGVLLQPTVPLAAALEWLSDGRDDRRAELAAVARWVSEFVRIPGRFFREWVTDFYRDNRLYSGTLALGGRPARLERIRCPVLAVAAAGDPIAPPDSVRALLEVVGSEDRTYLEIGGGHLALVFGSMAAHRTWPTIARWLASACG